MRLGRPSAGPGDLLVGSSLNLGVVQCYLLGAIWTQEWPQMQVHLQKWPKVICHLNMELWTVSLDLPALVAPHGRAEEPLTRC